MNKAVIFDLDGTLIDSLPDIAEHVNITLEKFGEPKKDYDFIGTLTGDGARNLISRSFDGKFSGAELDERLDYYNRIYTDSGSPKTRVFDGVGEMLIELKKRGYKLGILTNKPQMTTDVVYERLLSQYGFDIVVGSRLGMKIKPDPTMLLQMLKEIDVLPENCYFVGDDKPDAQIAINAGVKGVSELWGYRSKEFLVEAGAKVFASTPKELLQIIK